MTILLIDLIALAGNLLTILIFARVVISWVNASPRNPLVNFVYRITEPIMAPVRRLLPSFGGLDFSPILVLFGIRLAMRVLTGLVIRIAESG